MRISRRILWIASIASLLGLMGCGDKGIDPKDDGGKGLPGSFYMDRTMLRYDHVWAFSPDHMFVIAEYGAVLEIEGNSRVLLPTESDADLRDIWASSPTDVYVVGAKPDESGGEILRYNGRSWRSMRHPLKGAINGVFGSGSGDVYAVTSEGEIARYNGFWWKIIHTVDIRLTDGWASGPGDVHVVGDDGLYTRYDGSSWESLIWSHDPFIGVRGIGETGAWLFGEHVVMSVDSMQIDDMLLSDLRGGHNAVASNDPDDLYIVGHWGRIIRYNGVRWDDFEVEGMDGSDFDLSDVSMTGPACAVAVGPDAMVVDIDGYTTSFTRGEGGWRVLGGTGNLVLAAAHSSQVMVHDGLGWSDFDPPIPQDLGGEVLGIWAASPDDIWGTVGGFPSFVIHYDGTTWQSRFENDDILQAIWGAAADDIFAVSGYQGNIYHYDGSSWALMADTGYERVLLDIWGSGGDDVYIVGAYTTNNQGGAVLHYDGTDWSVDPTYFEHDLFGVAGTSPTDVVAVGKEGAIYRFDGTAWNREASSTTHWLKRVWAGAPDDYWAVGVEGTLLHYNGDSWQTIELGLESMLWSVWGTDAGNVFICGTDGNLLRYSAAGP